MSLYRVHKKRAQNNWSLFGLLKYGYISKPLSKHNVNFTSVKGRRPAFSGMCPVFSDHTFHENNFLSTKVTKPPLASVTYIQVHLT